jgi:hypothetical protein
MWQDDSLATRYNPDAYQQIIQGLQSGEAGVQITALQDLADTFAYGDANLLGNFPVVPVAQLLIQLLTSRVEAVKETSALCMFSFLEAHPESTRALLGNGALQTMNAVLTSFDSFSTAEHLLRAAEIISQFRPGELAQHLGIGPLISYFDFLTITDQRIIAKCVAQTLSQAAMPQREAFTTPQRCTYAMHGFIPFQPIRITHSSE